jgi:hypothetical protein
MVQAPLVSDLAGVIVTASPAIIPWKGLISQSPFDPIGRMGDPDIAVAQGVAVAQGR